MEICCTVTGISNAFVIAFYISFPTKKQATALLSLANLFFCFRFYLNYGQRVKKLAVSLFLQYDVDGF